VSDSAAPPAASGNGRVRRYEVVFDCRDRVMAHGLVAQLEAAGAPGAVSVRRVEEGTTWAVAFDFAGARAADEFFTGEAYHEACVAIRRAIGASVLVVPLGEIDATT